MNERLDDDGGDAGREIRVQRVKIVKTCDTQHVVAELIRTAFKQRNATEARRAKRIAMISLIEGHDDLALGMVVLLPIL